MNKKFALVDLKGGLGNQIFIICFANHLKKNGFKVYLDTSFYKTKQPFPRNIEINLENTGLKVFNFKNNRIFFFLNTWFEEIKNLEDYKFSFLNRFTGYYQNFKFLTPNKEYLKNVLNIQSTQTKQNKALIHIRRDDYITLNENLSLSYYENAINRLLDKNPKIKFDIFTDDKNFSLNTNIFRNTENIFFPSQNEKALEVLKNMIGYEHYIIANSSLSLIAAYISSNSDTNIYYPDPWWKNFEVSINEIPPHWIKINNE